MAEVNPVTYITVMRQICAFKQQLNTRPDWGIVINHQSIIRPPNRQNMVALSFATAADRQEASVEHFTFDTIDELQECLDFVWRNLYTKFCSSLSTISACQI